MRSPAAPLGRQPQTSEAEHLFRALRALDTENAPYIERRRRIVEAIRAAGGKIDPAIPETAICETTPEKTHKISDRAAIQAAARSQRGIYTSHQVWASMRASNPKENSTVTVARVSRVLHEMRVEGEIRISTRQGRRGPICYEKSSPG